MEKGGAEEGGRKDVRGKREAEKEVERKGAEAKKGVVEGWNEGRRVEKKKERRWEGREKSNNYDEKSEKKGVTDS